MAPRSLLLDFNPDRIALPVDDLVALRRRMVRNYSPADRTRLERVFLAGISDAATDPDRGLHGRVRQDFLDLDESRGD